MKKPVLLITCVSAIYISFLSWSYLQEKLTSSDYSLSKDLNNPVYFNSPLVINLVQSLFSVIIGSIYLFIETRNDATIRFFPKLPKNSIYLLYLISISQSISSPLSYMSLNYVDYLLYLLAKSCKLIPVMLVHFVCFGTIYSKIKYLIALLITIGVSVFTISSSSSSKNNSNNPNSNLFFGLSLLIASLFLDGFMNSAQDILFKKSNNLLKSAHLMTFLNFFTFINLLVYTLLFSNEISEFSQFVKSNDNNKILMDLFKFCLCGSLGQIFIFITLQEFNSVVLVTVTVTRKMLSMIISVLLFGHVLNMFQWLGLLLVFFGVGLESFVKIFNNKQKVKKQ